MSSRATVYEPQREVDRVEVILLVDNVIDMLSTISRPDVSRTWWDREDTEPADWRDIPLAEHGFSALIRFWVGAERHTVLFDAGTSGRVALHNARFIDQDWREIEAIALSHGHFDHTGGIPHVLEAIGPRRMPIVAHEHMFSRYAVKDKEGRIKPAPANLKVTRDQMTALGAELLLNRDTVDLFDGALLVMGEIPRQTDFEDAPHPQLMREVDGQWVSAPWVWDDRSLVLSVRDEGLVIVSGCAHAGIVNTLLHAQAIAGNSRIRAVIGGFHLAGKRFEPRIPATVDAVTALQPDLIIPTHCTGARGPQAFAAALPDATVTGGVLLRARIGSWED